MASITTGSDQGGGSSNARRRIPSRGIVIALVGPDGVGKTSQSAQLTRILQERFRCTAVYLGSGDGGWRLRRFAKRQYRRWRPKTQPKSEADAPVTGTNHSLNTALSGLATALERYVNLHRAMRLAASGSVVISDRWPQNLQSGMFDGPLRLHPHASGIVRLLSRIERNLYRRMQPHKPALTIHLISDFKTANARKPGDRSPAEFEQRLSLMEEMRKLDPSIKVVDARGGFDEVTRELLICVECALSEQTSRPRPSASARR